MEDQYEMTDLRHYAGGRAFLHATAQPPDFPPTHPYYLLNFCPDNHAGVIAPPGAAIASADAGGCLITAAGFGTEVGGDSGAGRWPRQETLTLLEIRSRLDARFKEANQKGPLWDEVSRIMYDEYGYQRSGKKCKEKFENLYKYYKKTKGGKAGRQDGKHYRFFKQLEALYGDQTGTSKNNYSSASISGQPDFSGPNFPKNTNPFRNINNNQESYQSLVSISNSSDFDTIITSEDDSTELNFLDTEVNDPKMAEKISKKKLKAKIKDSIDIQMKKMIEKQEAWMEKMMMTIEENEKERIFREEQWRKQDAERVEREQRLWAGEKAWILARDAALMEAFGKLTGKESRVSHQDDEFIVQSQNESPKIEWTNSNVATWDRMSDRFIKCGKKRMGPYQVGLVLEGHGPDHGVNSSLDNDSNDGCFRYFGDDNA